MKNTTLFLSGILLIFCFFSLAETHQGLGVSFTGPTAYESSQELNFWLGAVLFLLPGFTLALLPFRSRLTQFFARCAEILNDMPAREKKLSLVILFIFAFFCARIGHLLILRDFPVTDDEWAAQVAGPILASGKFMNEIWEPFKSYMHPFMYANAGRYTSFELPGVGAIWAFGDLVGDSALGWALVAAIPILPVILITKRYLDEAWVLLAALLYFLSPQALTLSLTTHSHLLSRAMLSLGLLMFVNATEDNRKFRDSALFGLVTGLGYLSRPYEFGALLLPFHFVFLYQALHERANRLRYLGGFTAGLAAPAAFFGYYNLQTTGRLFFMTRMQPAYMVYDFPAYTGMRKSIEAGTEWSVDLVWRRFGANFTNNLLGVWMWFFAPIGCLFAALGIGETRLTKTLGVSLFLCFAIALFHDNYGIHLVGPINYSECIPVLALLATFGARRAFAYGESLAPSIKTALATVLTASVLSSLVFIAVNWIGLRQQAAIHESMYGFVEGGVETFWGTRTDRKAVILADQYIKYWWVVPEMQKIGSYVYDWRVPRSDLQDRIMFLKDDPTTIQEILKKFGDRDFFRITSLHQPPYIEMHQVDPHTGLSIK